MIYSLMEFSERAAYEQKQAFIDYDYMHIMCEALEDVATNGLPGEAKNLGINIPPRHYKTTFASINWLAWCMGEIAPDCEFINTSATAGLAEGNTMSVRSLIRQPWYQELYPNVRVSKENKDVQKWFKTTSGGSVYGAGMEGTITGFGAGKTRDGFGGAVMMDDPLKANARRYPAQLKTCRDNYTGTLYSRRNNVHTTPFVLIMQRICDGDLADWIQKNEDKEDWHWLVLPALKDGKLLNPTTMSVKHLKKIKRYDPDTYYAQYQQDTKKAGTRMFKKEYWGFYRVLPNLRRKMIYADTAQKDKTQHDYSVLQCWGQGFDNKLYLVDQMRGKWTGPNLRRNALAFWELHKEGCSAFKVEDKVSGTDLIQSLGEKGLPMVEIPRAIDKYTRQLDAVPYIANENKNIVLPEFADWVEDYIDEFWQAPNGDFDDQIDPTIDAIIDMIGSGTYDYGDLN